MTVKRSRIDDVPSDRKNSLKRGELSNFTIVRDGFKCMKCGHEKAFYKRILGGYECTSCKHVQHKKNEYKK